jgi:hypothetical protein
MDRSNFENQPHQSNKLYSAVFKGFRQGIISPVKIFFDKWGILQEARWYLPFKPTTSVQS